MTGYLYELQGDLELLWIQAGLELTVIQPQTLYTGTGGVRHYSQQMALTFSENC